MAKIKFSKEQAKLITNMSVTVSDGTGDGPWHYLPYWFKDNQDGTFDVVQPEKLPESIRKVIIAVKEESLLKLR